MDAFNSLTHSPKRSVNAKNAGPMRGRILILLNDDEIAEQIISALGNRERVRIDRTTSVSEAVKRISDDEFDLILCDLDLGRESNWQFMNRPGRKNLNMRTVVLGRRAHFADAMAAIRAGAVDYLAQPADHDNVAARVWKAFDDAVRDRHKEATIHRLRRICKQLNAARLDVTSQIDDLCNDLVQAYDELAGQISHVTTVTEFSAIIQQELDVEDLLRTTLEYFLRRIGPMNAAVFLPGTADEFTLGAYINYDCPKDSADFMLDQLADVIPQQMIDETRVLEFRGDAELENWLGDNAHWLSDSHAVSFACRHEDECLAVFTLFRNMNMPFDDQFVPLMESVAEVFGKQLAHVIHVHHRALPPESDNEFGFGNDWSSDGDGFLGDPDHSDFDDNNSDDLAA